MFFLNNYGFDKMKLELTISPNNAIKEHINNIIRRGNLLIKI